MRCLYLLLCIFLWCGPSFAEELRLLTDTSFSWVARSVPEDPANEWETLALRAVVAGTTVKQDRLTAYLLGQQDSFDLVTVEEASENPGDPFLSVRSYRIGSGKIRDETQLKYSAKPNPEDEMVAREVAKDYLLGRGNGQPFIFNGKVHDVQYDGKCILSIVARDELTVYFTFRFSRCK
jgi:hypothetical protein